MRIYFLCWQNEATLLTESIQRCERGGIKESKGADVIRSDYIEKNGEGQLHRSEDKSICIVWRWAIDVKKRKFPMIIIH